MNFNHIFSEIEKADPDFYDRTDTRRSTLSRFKNIGFQLGLAAVPFALGSLFKKSYAGTTKTNDVLEILNYALTLEHLEAAFYTKAVQNPQLFTSQAGFNAFNNIKTHEVQHVDLLTNTISSMGGTPVSSGTYDFTAGNGSNNGPFANVFTNYNTLLAVAQGFEDTGVRAYKGRAAELVGGGDLLTVALNIHSVEARHASHIRQMRKAAGADVRPWVTGNTTGGVPGIEAIYAGEENTIQAGIQIININGQTFVTAAAASEAFDEGLAPAQVLAIVDPFIV